MPNSLVTISRAWLAAAFSLLSSCTRRSRAACSAHLSSHSDPVRWTPAQRDGFQIALDSIIVTTLMTGVRIGIAILTGSLSVLAAAADSGMDVTASVVTWLAVRLSSKPPDRNHLYGHGKAENFSALTEAILMLGASAVIGRVAVRSLLLPPAEVSASLWAFVTMALSLGVDLYRSRALGVAAARHRSEALEADAFRLRVHVWSGVVVLFGLACARAAECFPAWGDLRHGDAVAAFIMAGLFAGTGLKLGYQAAQGLLDAAPEGAIDAIHRALAPLAGVALCGPVRARRCGAHVYVDVHAAMNGRLTLREAHELSDAIEARIRAFLPGAEVTVHPEPAGMMGGGPGREVSKHG